MKILPVIFRTLVLAGTAISGPAAHASASLRDEVDLIQALQLEPPCCVIDARSQINRQQHALTDALPWRAGLRIVPTASVIVVGDDDPGALKVANVLAKQHPGKAIYVVRGGVIAWEFVQKALAKVSSSRADGAPPIGGSFVIPKNTCESGETLQVLSSKTKSKP